MQKNVIALGGKRSLAGKNYKLAHEKRILGWAKMDGAAMVLGSKPTRCVNCKAIISADILSGCAKDDNDVSQVNCPECLETFPFKIRTASGSPLNLALIGHWDAWQPFRTSYRSCGSIEISIANMYKRDRVYVLCLA